MLSELIGKKLQMTQIWNEAERLADAAAVYDTAIARVKVNARAAVGAANQHLGRSVRPAKHAADDICRQPRD